MEQEEALPEWIPADAAAVYLTWRRNIRNDGPGDPRWPAALEALFRSNRLIEFWAHFAPPFKFRVATGWNHLIGVTVMATENIPEEGKGTRNNPALKNKIRARQARADRLRKKGAKLAADLCEVLQELSDPGADIPGEVYSTQALLAACLRLDPMARANCEDELNEFWRHKLSSYQEHRFPKPAALIHALHLSLDNALDVDEHFAANPWLSSQKASPLDFVRVLMHGLQEGDEMYGGDVLQRLRTVDIVNLVVVVGGLAPGDAESIRKGYERIRREQGRS